MRSLGCPRVVIGLSAEHARPLQRMPFAARIATTGGKLVVVTTATVFAVMVGVFTGVPWSWIAAAWGLLATAVAVVPRATALAMPVMAYAGVWVGFNALRSRADGTSWADQRLGFVARVEQVVFDGTLPSAVFQGLALVPSWDDYGWTAIYVSFFIVPHLVALLLLWCCRPLFWRYVLALTVLFTLALIGFFALPTAPPWLVTEVVSAADFAHIVRVVPVVATHLDLPVQLYHQGLRGSVVVSEVRIEPNPMAAMPSIHFATTALLVYPALAAGRLRGAIAWLYTLLMGIALVYLGEHYVLDLIVGGLFAAIGWIAAGRLLARRQSPPRP